MVMARNAVLPVTVTSTWAAVLVRARTMVNPRSKAIFFIKALLGFTVVAESMEFSELWVGLDAVKADGIGTHVGKGLRLAGARNWTSDRREWSREGSGELELIMPSRNARK